MANGFIIPKVRYESPNEDGTVDRLAKADLELTKRIAGVVELHYPGHPWLIEVDHSQGVAFISIPLFMGRNKYVLHIQNLKTDPTFRSVVRACGELLERYRIPRKGFNRDDFLTALQSVPFYKRATSGYVPT